MKEIEAKILDINREEVEKKLLELGAKKVFEGELIAYLYDKNKELKSNGKILRLRKEGDKTILCLKEDISRDIVKEVLEVEFEVSDFKKAKLLIEKLGYETRRETTKRRISYHLDTVHFDFDLYSGELGNIPEFLEIEAKSKQEVIRYAMLLGFEQTKLKSWTTSDVIRHYKK